MRIILTGSKGFIGKNIHDRLKIYGEEVIEVNYEDCLDFRDTFDEWDTIDMVIHQGAISSTTCTDLNKLHKYNIDYSVWLFEQAIKHQIPVKYASSASVYGGAAGSHTGFNWTINPLNFYALSKLTVDYWVQDHMDEFISVQGFRYHNVYGRGEDNKGNQASPVHTFSKQARETGVIKVFEGSDRFLRDFVCVDDVVEVVLNNDKGSGIYDLGTSKPMSFQQVAELIAIKFNAKIESIPFPPHLEEKYQKYTNAMEDFKGYKFKTLEDYLLI
tara:strand:+ start:72 stop:887 length:816 start_codon:yes stop_codon:yes gene_type:complete